MKFQCLWVHDHASEATLTWRLGLDLLDQGSLLKQARQLQQERLTLRGWEKCDAVDVGDAAGFKVWNLETPIPMVYGHLSSFILSYIFPQTVWPHWGVSVRARCLIEVVSGASGIFLVNFYTKWLLWHVRVHFDCAGSHKTRHLTQKSCQKTSSRELVKKSCQETSYGDLLGDLARRPLTEILPTELL